MRRKSRLPPRPLSPLASAAVIDVQKHSHRRRRRGDGSLEERIGYRFKDAALLDSALFAHLLAQGRPQPMPTASSRTGSAPRLIRRFRDASASSPPEPGWALAESALRRSCIGAPNRAQHRFNVSRLGTARHPHPDGSDHEAKFA